MGAEFAQVRRNSGVTLFLERSFAHCGVFAVCLLGHSKNSDCSGVDGFVGHKNGSVVWTCAGKSDGDPMAVGARVLQPWWTTETV